MNQLFRDAFTLPGGLGGAGITTGINLYETTDSYIVQVLLPAVNPEQLNITARENVLTRAFSSPSSVRCQGAPGSKPLAPHVAA